MIDWCTVSRFKTGLDPSNQTQRQDIEAFFKTVRPLSPGITFLSLSMAVFNRHV